MRFPSRFNYPEIPVGSTRQKRVFAWIPTRVKDYIVWMGFYEVLQAYVSHDYIVIVDGKNQGYRVNDWVDISKRVMN